VTRTREVAADSKIDVKGSDRIVTTYRQQRRGRGLLRLLNLVCRAEPPKPCSSVSPARSCATDDGRRFCDTTPPHRVRPQRSALGEQSHARALLLRDLVVLKKHFGEFVIRNPGPAVPSVLRVSLRLPEDRAKASAAMGDGESPFRDRARTGVPSASVTVPRRADPSP